MGTEHRHEHLRPLISADWLLEREDLDLAERLNKLGFSCYDAGADADSQESTRTGAGAGAGTKLATLQQEYNTNCNPLVLSNFKAVGCSFDATHSDTF